MATQLFKFVTPRDPKKASSETTSSVFDLGKLQNEQGYRESLFFKLLTVMQNDKLSAPQRIEEINKLLILFTSSGQYLVDVEQFDQRFGHYANFYDQSILSLSRSTAKNKHPHWLTKERNTLVDDLYCEAKESLPSDATKEGWLSPAEKFTLVDNLLAQAISVANPQLMAKSCSVLKLLNLLRHLDEKGSEIDDKKALKLLKLPIGIPNSFKVPSIKKAVKVPQDDSRLKVEIRNKFTNYQNHLGASKELLNLIENQGRDRSSTVKDDHGGYELGKLNASDKMNLSKPTQEILDKLRIGENSDLLKALADVRASGGDAAKDLSGHLVAKRQTMVLGGNVVYKDEFQSEISNVIWNEDDTGGVIIANNGECGLRFPFKIANLRVVEQELLSYEPGYIAHIQNTLQGEFNEKTTRRLSRTEESFSSSYEKDVLDERDTQSTDRFNMERETSKTIQEDTEKYVNGQLTAGYGPVSLSIGAGYSNNTSTEESNSEAISYSKDVVQRSLQRLIEKTKEEKSTKTINEFEETNKHGLDNRGGSQHVVGIYRWLDQLNKVTIKTYDKRMMIEIMVPQPAKYHLSNFVENKDLEIGIDDPVHPRDLELPEGMCTGLYNFAIQSHRDIHYMNYHLLAAEYGAAIDPYPQQVKKFTHSFVDADTKESNVVATKESKDIIIPDGYRAYSILSTFKCDNNGAYAVYFFLGGNWMPSDGIISATAPFDFEGNMNVVSVRWNSAHIGASFHITCILTETAYETWQIKTYNAILAAYEKKKAAYNNAAAEAKANAGIRIRGTNPTYNKELIRTELKKQAIYLMSHCKFVDNVAVDEKGKVASCCEAFDKGQVIKFIDSVFEWKNLTYSLYDYFYAQQGEWKLLYNISDPDPLMNNFLKAGEARVIIPVAKGKEIAAINFLTLGKPWINDLLSMDILDVADEFITEEPLEEIVIYDDDPSVDPPLLPLVTPTTLTILECSSGGVKPTRYLIKGEQCIGEMTPATNTESGGSFVGTDD